MSFIPGAITPIQAQVRNLVGGLPYTSGTIYAIIQLRDGSADDGKYWDTDSGGSWQASPVSLPTMTHQRNGLWYYALPAAATSQRWGAKLEIMMTDNATTPGSETAGSGSFTVSMAEISLQVILDYIESQRGHHTVTGRAFFVSPTNGSDSTGDGSRANPYQTIPAAHTACTAWAHDMIFVIADSPSGVTTINTGGLTLNKAYVQVRSVGRGILLTRNDNGTTVTLAASGISLSGFRIGTHTTGTGSGVAITSGADFCGLHQCWVEDTAGDGLTVTDATNTLIEHCIFEGAGQTGAGRSIDLVATTAEIRDTVIRHCHVGNAPNGGIRLTASGLGTINDTVIKDVIVHGCTGYGVDIATSAVVGTVICHLCGGNNSLGDVRDLGTGTVESEEHLLVRHATHGFYDGVIYVDTVSGVSTTRLGKDGTSGNPVTWAAALTLSAALGVKRFHIAQGSTVTPTAVLTGATLFGDRWILGSGGYIWDNCVVRGAQITGSTPSGASAAAPVTYIDCRTDSAAQTNIGSNVKMVRCALQNDISTPAAGGIRFVDCYVDTATGTLTWNTTSSSGLWYFDNFHGDMTITNAFDSTLVFSGAGLGEITITSPDTCTIEFTGSGKPYVITGATGCTIDDTGYNNPSAIDTELQILHGSNSWETGGLTGSNDVTVHLQDSITGDPIVGALVTVYNATNTGTPLDQQTTDSNGDASFSMDAGTYKLRINAVGVSFTYPETLVVATNPQSTTFEGVTLNIASPANPDGCVVYGTLQDCGIVAHSSLTITAVYETPQALGSIIGTTREVTTTSNGSGYWQLELAQGATVLLTIGSTNVIVKRFVVPAAASYDFSTEL